MQNKATIYNSDCNKVLKTIESESIDLVLTDPPYNVSKKNNFHTMKRKGVDFGEWDKEADIISYIEDVYRVTKKGGSFIVFSAWKNLGDIANKAESLGFEAKDVLRLIKTNPMPRNRDRRYIVDFEFAIWFVKKGKKWTFNRIDPNFQRPEFKAATQRGQHPTQKPLDVMMDLIKIHSNENDTILDPFMGSGTTGKAALELKRNFIGIELDQKYFELSKKNLEKISGVGIYYEE